MSPTTNYVMAAPHWRFRPVIIVNYDTFPWTLEMNMEIVLT